MSYILTSWFQLISQNSTFASPSAYISSIVIRKYFKLIVVRKSDFCDYSVNNYKPTWTPSTAYHSSLDMLVEYISKKLALNLLVFNVIGMVVVLWRIFLLFFVWITNIQLKTFTYALSSNWIESSILKFGLYTTEVFTKELCYL